MEVKTKEKNLDKIGMRKGGEGRMEGLHTALKDMMKRAYELQQICDGILKSCCEKEELAFPIDIKKIAQARGIKLAYENLNFGGEEEIDLNIAQLRYDLSREGKVVRKIYVDNSQNESYLGETSEPYSNLQKYAIAYELGKTIVKEESDQEIANMTREEIRRRNMKSVPYSLSKLYARQESFEYEMCAIFLLLPLELFFEEFYLYLKTRTISPVYMERWIKHLSEKTEIPNYQLINGYQYIKFCACQYYQEKSEEIDLNDYWELFQ